MAEDFVDPCIDQKTGILGNLVGAFTLNELKQAEGELVGARLLELMANPPVVNDGSLAELKEIHRHLFQDTMLGPALPEPWKYGKRERL